VESFQPWRVGRIRQKSKLRCELISIETWIEFGQANCAEQMLRRISKQVSYSGIVIVKIIFLDSNTLQKRRTDRAGAAAEEKHTT